VDIGEAGAAALDDQARRAGSLVLVELSEGVEDEAAVGLLDVRGIDALGLDGYDGLLSRLR